MKLVAIDKVLKLKALSTQYKNKILWEWVNIKWRMVKSLMMRSVKFNQKFNNLKHKSVNWIFNLNLTVIQLQNQLLIWQKEATQLISRQGHHLQELKHSTQAIMELLMSIIKELKKLMLEEYQVHMINILRSKNKNKEILKLIIQRGYLLSPKSRKLS